MRSVLSAFLFMAIAASGFAQEDLETITIKTSIVCNHCMECDDCGYNIDTSIRKAKGIKKVVIDPEGSTVMVTYRTDKTTQEEIRIALSKAGFDADDVKADPEAYAKLDGCCKKPE
ncbi:MAG: heavy-metal-associated domain-containing protein [Flavobacteriales bacterium]|nr:heavy-metal-associated domain-containing protein [Flavobacteriales bacterium]